MTGTKHYAFTANLNSAQYLVIYNSGPYLYATHNGSNTVSAYQISQMTGALTPLSATIANGSGPEFATLDPSGTHLYVANNGDGVEDRMGTGNGVGVPKEVNTTPIASSMASRSTPACPAPYPSPARRLQRVFAPQV